MATESSITIVVLTSQNYPEWFDGIKRKAEALEIWTYINPDTAIQAPRVTPLPEPSSIQINAASIADLSADNQSILATQLSLWKTYNDHARQIGKAIQIIYEAVEKSTMSYNTVILRTNSLRSALKALKDHLKPTQFEAEEALRHEYHELCKSPAKKTIEDWILKWVALQNNIARLGMLDISDTMLARGFLKGAEKWAPAMAKTWGIYKQDSEGKLNFQDTLREFRRSYPLETVSAALGFATTLQEDNTSSKKRPHEKLTQRQPPPCVCGGTHFFKDCGYIRKEAAGPKFKEIPTKRADIKSRIQQNKRIFNALKKLCSDTGILDGISFSETKESKPKEQNFTLGNATPTHTVYANTVVAAVAEQVHPLQDSVIYDTGASDHICNDLSIMTNIRDAPPNGKLSTASGNLAITKYGTMTVRTTVNGQPKVLHLPNASYVPGSAVNLASVQKLKNFGVKWNRTTTR